MAVLAYDARRDPLFVYANLEAQRWWIEGGIIWNVRSSKGELWGQAALFRGMRPGDL